MPFGDHAQMKLVFGKKGCANRSICLGFEIHTTFSSSMRERQQISSNLTLLLSGGRHPCACQPRGHGRDLGGRRVIVILGGGCGGRRCQAELEDVAVVRHSVGAAPAKLDPAATADAAAPRRDRRPRRQGAQRPTHERDRGK